MEKAQSSSRMLVASQLSPEQKLELLNKRVKVFSMIMKGLPPAAIADAIGDFMSKQMMIQGAVRNALSKFTVDQSKAMEGATYNVGPYALMPRPNTESWNC